MNIVTLEDLVEKIVGSIHDEYDSDENPDISPIGNAFRIQGAASLETVQEHFGIPLPVNEYDTLSGFLVGRLGHIPVEGEKPEIIYEGLCFTVENVKDKRIALVTASKCDET